MISAAGRAQRFASLPAGSSLTGIAFDATGRFGHKLLVTAELRGGTTVFGIGCDGRPAPVTTGGPPVEGGIVVAPATFGGFGGDLIAPNETSGRVYAVSPSGQVVILAQSGLPAGGDVRSGRGTWGNERFGCQGPGRAADASCCKLVI